MGKLAKILIVFIVLVLVVIGGLTAAVKFYLTDERLRGIIVQQAETVLGRSVEIGRIDVSLFKGITVNSVAVKEKDGDRDFVSAKAFILRYDLMPLLQGRVDVSEVRLEEPFIRVTRNREGAFNFQTLAILSDKKTTAEPKSGGSGAALPVALTVNRITVEKARLEVRDAQKTLPDIDGTADLALGLDMGRDLASLKYTGDLSFDATARYGSVSPAVSGSADFDAARIGFKVRAAVDEDVLDFEGSVEGYRGTPRIQLDISSGDLSVDRLKAVLAGLPAASATAHETGTSKKAEKTGTPSPKIPAGFALSGTVEVGKTSLGDLAIEDLKIRYSLDDKSFRADITIPHIAKGDTLRLDATMGLDSAFTLPETGKPVFRGTATLKSGGTMKEIKLALTAKADFDQNRVGFEAEADVEGEAATVSGEAKNYLSSPNLRLDLTSRKLNLDHLIAIAGAAAGPPEDGASATEPAPTPPGPARPAKPVSTDLTAGGTVRIDTTTYRELAITDFNVIYALAGGVLTVKELRLRTADGSLTAAATADIGKADGGFKGNAKIASVQLAGLVAGLAPKAAGTLQGTTNGTCSFTGSGTDWPRVRETLNLTGDYGIDKLLIRAPVTETVAALLGLSDLREMAFDKATGNLRIEDGILRLNTRMGGDTLSATAVGDIGLDGTLNLPVALTLSEDLGRQLREKAGIARYLVKEKGSTTLKLKVVGTLAQPRPGIDEKAVQEEIEKKVTETAAEKIGEILGGKKKEQEKKPEGNDQKQEPEQQKPNPVGDVLKGLFGR